jgi:hypothetical protein
MRLSRALWALLCLTAAVAGCQSTTEEPVDEAEDTGTILSTKDDGARRVIMRAEGTVDGYQSTALAGNRYTWDSLTFEDAADGALLVRGRRHVFAPIPGRDFRSYALIGDAPDTTRWSVGFAVWHRQPGDEAWTRFEWRHGQGQIYTERHPEALADADGVIRRFSRVSYVGGELEFTAAEEIFAADEPRVSGAIRLPIEGPLEFKLFAVPYRVDHIPQTPLPFQLNELR